MVLSDDKEERIAIIADGCKVSQAEAERIWRESQKLATDHLAVKVERRVMYGGNNEKRD